MMNTKVLGQFSLLVVILQVYQLIFGCQNPPQNLADKKANLFVIKKKDNIDGLSFNLLKQSTNYTFEAVWQNANEEVRQSKYLISTKERGVENVSWGEKVLSFQCLDNGTIVINVQRLYLDKLIEEQEYQMNCPLDVQAGNIESELRLQTLLSQPDRDQIFLGEVYLNSEKALAFPVNREVKITILKLIAPERGGWMTVLPGLTMISKYRNQSYLVGIYQTYIKREKHPAFQEELSVNGDLMKALLSKKIDSQDLIFPRVTVEIGELQGRALLQTLGADGAQGKRSESAFSARYKLTNAIVNPPGPAENDKTQQILTNNGSRVIRETVCAGLGSPGQKGNSGTIQGAPGADGGPGLAPIGIDVNVIKATGSASLVVTQKPFSGGSPSTPGAGQSGSVGGLGGQKFCSNNSNERYPSGPPGDSASPGEAGEVGQRSGCTSFNVRLASALSVTSKFEECPVNTKFNYLTVQSQDPSLKEINYITPMKVIETKISTLGTWTDSFKRHNIDPVIE